MERILEPQSHFIERDGVRLHALDHGGSEKPILLLIHGAAAHAHWWDRFVPDFAERFRPVAVDLRGHGDSDWAEDYDYGTLAGDLAAWVEWAREASGRPPAILGHSLGGVTALKLHEGPPRELHSLVVVDAPLQVDDRILSDLRPFAQRKSRPWPSRELFAEKFRLIPSSGSPDPELLAHIARLSLRPTGEGTWILKADRSFHLKRKGTDLRAGWKRVSAPALLIVGGESDRLSEKEIAWIGEECPQVRIEVIARANHHVQLEAPEEFLRIALNFYAQDVF